MWCDWNTLLVFSFSVSKVQDQNQGPFSPLHALSMQGREGSHVAGADEREFVANCWLSIFQPFQPFVKTAQNISPISQCPVDIWMCMMTIGRSGKVSHFTNYHTIFLALLCFLFQNPTHSIWMSSVYADIRNNWETGNYDSSIHQAWRETAAPSKKSKVCTNLLERKSCFREFLFLPE